ncbi:pyridoxamine 5'-phosphate oxidase family protein [Ancylomarina longa]|uniref:Pyridoxamine 5'-phosphate oxidase family protein n=1 Tax=Ancylomarina longa TaxID=2487017 RepID=A0A434AX85_9BACT|nr:pyridoxamine 5'-phosphate oxidase family protein [Ancylomarina longa]RUT79113.1 pyridoxamine 5'-phosphate oxidase family protein [Ancylomarina longa]
MDHKIRKQERKVSDSEAIEILQQGEFGVLSMCTTEKEGYGIPLNYVLHDNAIYFHGAKEGFKLDTLQMNNKVSFCVVGKTRILPDKFSTIYESTIAFGSISEIEGSEKQAALELFLEKYSNDFIPKGKKYINKLYDEVLILKLSIENLTGKARMQ